jgi:hypothetical protein
VVKRDGAAALRQLLIHDPRLALDIAKGIAVGNDQALAEELCMFTDVHCDGRPDAFDDQDYRVFLDKLEHINELCYHSCRFLGEAAKRVPGDVVDLLLRRIRREATADRRFDAIPDEGLTEALTPLATRPDYPALLRRVRDASIPGGPHQRSVAAFYKALSFNHNDAGIAVLQEWADSDGRAKIEAVVMLLQAAEYDFAFEQTDFVTRLLESAERHGADCVDDVLDCFYTGAALSERRGVAGRPFPRDIALRDRARSEIKIHAPGTPLHRLFTRVLRTAEKNIEEVRMEVEEHEE